MIVPAEATSRIQEMHILLGHLLCEALERELGLA
jgi:D-sedoheptulose 7-phosphate isomerase